MVKDHFHNCSAPHSCLEMWQRVEIRDLKVVISTQPSETLIQLNFK